MVFFSFINILQLRRPIELKFSQNLYFYAHLEIHQLWRLVFDNTNSVQCLKSESATCFPNKMWGHCTVHAERTLRNWNIQSKESLMQKRFSDLLSNPSRRNHILLKGIDLYHGAAIPSFSNIDINVTNRGWKNKIVWFLFSKWLLASIIVMEAAWSSLLLVRTLFAQPKFLYIYEQLFENHWCNTTTNNNTSFYIAFFQNMIKAHNKKRIH